MDEVSAQTDAYESSFGLQTCLRFSSRFLMKTRLKSIGMVVNVDGNLIFDKPWLETGSVFRFVFVEKTSSEKGQQANVNNGKNVQPRFNKDENVKRDVQKVLCFSNQNGPEPSKMRAWRNFSCSLSLRGLPMLQNICFFSVRLALMAKRLRSGAHFLNVASTLTGRPRRQERSYATRWVLGRRAAALAFSRLLRQGMHQRLRVHFTWRHRL